MTSERPGVQGESGPGDRTAAQLPPLGGTLPDPAQGPGSARSDGDSQRWVQGWRRTILAAGMLAYPLVTAGGLAQYASGPRALAGYAIVAAFCCAYVAGAVVAARRPGARSWPVLGVLFVLFAAEVPFAREYAFFLCAVVVSFAAAELRRHAVPIVAGGTLAALLVPAAVPAWNSGPGWFEAVAVAFTAVTVCAFSEIAATNRALMEARAEVARLASEAERNRIARDLHDLLGHSLTVITVKSALARRLAAAGSPATLEEIAAVEQLSRQALADVRAAVTGYRDVSLAGELARGRELLRAAGIVADLPTATDVVDTAHRELFGWVVREGLTNVVRHASATRCTVTLSATHVEIRDDGVGSGSHAGGASRTEGGSAGGSVDRAGTEDGRAESAGAGAGAAGSGAAEPRTAGGGRAARVGGNGLAGLGERVAAAGGRVEAGPAEPRGWRLRVSVAGPGMAPSPS